MYILSTMAWEFPPGRTSRRWFCRIRTRLCHCWSCWSRWHAAYRSRWGSCLILEIGREFCASFRCNSKPEIHLLGRYNRNFGMPNWSYECCLIPCSGRKTCFSCSLRASLARFNLLLECISSRPKAMDVPDQRGAVLSSLLWLMSSHLWPCIKGLVNEGIVNFMWWLSIWLDLWRNEIAFFTPIGGF